MVRPTIFTQSNDQILTPAERPEDARWDAFAWGANLTVANGDMVAQKAADKLMYLYAAGATGGLGVALGFSKFSFHTGADGKPVIGTDSATPTWQSGGGNFTAPAYTKGTFDLADIKIGGVAVSALSDVTTAFGASRVVQEPNGFVRIL